MPKSEDELNKIKGLAGIVAVYAAAKSNILSILLQADRDAWTRGPDGKFLGSSAAFWNSRISEIRKINNGTLKPNWREFTGSAVPREYDRGAEYADGFIPSELRGSRPIPPGRAKKITNIAGSAVNDMNAGLDQGLSTIRKWARSSQQDVLAESEIDRLVAESMDPRQLKSNLTKSFEKALGLTDKSGGRFITVNGRNYQLDKYCDMLARTKTRAAQSQGTIESVRRAGMDLVQVSKHNTTTPVCIPHEGRRYSISGTSAIYPMLREIPGYHPNCLHVITPFIAAPEDSKAGIEQLAEDKKQRKLNSERIKEAA